MAVIKQKIASQATLLSTDLNALANGSLILSAAVNNVQGGGGTDGYTAAVFHLAVDFVSAPTANTGCPFWLIRSADGGTTYEDGGTSVTPARPFDGFFALRATTDAQVVSAIVPLPPGYFKVLILNSSGQAFPATGSTLKYAAYTLETV